MGDETEKLYAHVARAYLKEKGVYRFRMKRVKDMSDREVIASCHRWYEDKGLVSEYRAFEKDMLAKNVTVSPLPDWYWAKGLHDAQVLSVTELSFAPPDWKSGKPLRNCLEIVLNSAQAIYERDISKICLYNYTLEEPLALSEKQWWMGDHLTSLPDGSYRLQIELTDIHGQDISLTVSFETAKADRI